MLIVHILPTASFGGWSRDRYEAKFGVAVSFDSGWHLERIPKLCAPAAKFGVKRQFTADSKCTSPTHKFGREMTLVPNS